MIFLLECQVNLPYPQLKVEKENKKYAAYLLEDYAGLASELTSITQYSFQNFVKFKTLPNLSKTLENIAKVEMRHLEILGKLIFLLGETPKYAYDSKVWTGEAVDYNLDIKKMLESDITLEKKAIASYQKHITLINDKYIKDILKRIILDEEKHLECFCILLNQVKA